MRLLRRVSARPRRVAAALALVLVVIGGLVALTPTAASAHAVVVSSTPGDREQLTEAPAQVSVVFSEGVDTRLGGLSVIGTDGEAVDTGIVTQPTPEQVVVGLEPDLPDGTYIVNYRVVSDDGHPIGGSLVFSVGSPVDEASAAGLGVAEDPVMQMVAGMARFLAYLGALLAAGVAFFAWFVHDRVDHNRPLRAIVVWGSVLGAVGLVLMVLTQAALATGEGLAAAFTPETLVDTVTGSLGWSILTVSTGLAVAVVAMFQRHELAGQLAGFYGLLGVGVGFALWGHSAESTNTWLSVTSDAVHGSAAAMWFGGLIALAVVLVGRIRAGASGSDGTGDAGGPADTVGVVIRFSTVSTIAVASLALGGVAMSWVLLGGVSALWDSDYGRVLSVKLLVAALVAALAIWNHFGLLPAVVGADVEPGGVDQVPDGATDLEVVSAGDEAVASVELDAGAVAASWARLARVVRLEGIGLAAVLGLTAVLGGITPPVNAAGGTNVVAGPFNGTKAVAGGQLNMVLTPALEGTNSVHLSYSNAGRPADLAEQVTVEFTLPDKGIGPIVREPTKAGVGHWQILATDDLSIAGTWQVEVVSRLTEFEQERTVFEVPVSE